MSAHAPRHRPHWGQDRPTVSNGRILMLLAGCALLGTLLVAFEATFLARLFPGAPPVESWSWLLDGLFALGRMLTAVAVIVTVLLALLWWTGHALRRHE